MHTSKQVISYRALEKFTILTRRPLTLYNEEHGEERIQEGDKHVRFEELVLEDMPMDNLTAALNLMR